jgi:hypothetical protein
MAASRTELPSDLQPSAAQTALTCRSLARSDDPPPRLLRCPAFITVLSSSASLELVGQRQIWPGLETVIGEFSIGAVGPMSLAHRPCSFSQHPPTDIIGQPLIRLPKMFGRIGEI